MPKVIPVPSREPYRGLEPCSIETTLKVSDKSAFTAYAAIKARQ